MQLTNAPQGSRKTGAPHGCPRFFWCVPARTTRQVRIVPKVRVVWTLMEDRFAVTLQDGVSAHQGAQTRINSVGRREVEGEGSVSDMRPGFED